MAMLPIMLSCPEHGRLLEADHLIARAAMLAGPGPNQPAPDHVLALDRLTHQGLATAQVTLPRRPVHVGVWLRLLRTLLDEVSISTSQVRKPSAEAPERICDTA